MGKKILMTSASSVIAAVWFFSFILVILMLLYLYLRQFIEEDYLINAIETFSSVYAPYLGAILGFYFASRAIAARRTVGLTPYGIALTITILWNSVSLVLLSCVIVSYVSIEDTMSMINKLAPKMSLIVAPVIGYFFGKTDSIENT